VRKGAKAGLTLLVLSALVAGLQLAEPGDPLIARVYGVETIAIAAFQVWISIWAVRKELTTSGILRPLIPAVTAGLIVTGGDLVGLWFVFDIPPTAAGILSVVAYDVLLGVVLAVPVILIFQALASRPIGAPHRSVDASAAALLSAYRDVLAESERTVRRWRLWALLAHQLLHRHIRRTLEAVQREYAKRASEVSRGLDRAEARERRLIDDFLLSVPPLSRVVPIPTVATLVVLWKLVPGLVAVAAAVAAWIGGGSWALPAFIDPARGAVPDGLAEFVVNALALAVAFLLLMLVLTPAIHRRDHLLAKHSVCEREVILMDTRLGVPRTSRRLEYVMAGLPALPLVLYGGAVLAYALAGLFVYPSPEGPLGSLVERADLLNLGPVTGAVLAQAFLGAAAVWIAWVVRTRKATRVVFL
jgi:hypothetical protein